MKSKQIFILAGILAILLAGVFFRKTQKIPELTTQEFAPLDLSFDDSKASSMTLHRKNAGAEEGESAERVRLVLSEKGWEVASLWNARADKNKVENFMELIGGVKGEQRAQGKELFSDFEISDDQGFCVDFADASGKTLIGVVIGAKKPGPQSFFIRRKDKDIVYLTDADLLGKMGLYGEVAKEKPRSDYWVANDFLFFDAAKVTSFTTSRFLNGQETVTSKVVKEAGKWKFPTQAYPFEINGDKVGKHLNNLKTWKSQGVFDPKAKDYGFAKPSWQMKIGIENEPEITITVGLENPESAIYFMQVSGEPVVYGLSKYYFQNMDIDDAQFFKDEALGEFQYDKIQSFAVHADKQEYRVKPIEKNWDAMTDYLEGVAALRPVRLILDPKEQKGFNGKYWFEYQKPNEAPMTFEFGDLISDKKEYPVRLKGSSFAFTVTEPIFKSIFERGDRLKEPEPPKAAPAEASKT